MQEFQYLTSGDPPVVQLEKENFVVSSDKKKYEQYTLHIIGKNDNLVETITELNEQLTEQCKRMKINSNINSPAASNFGS